MRITIAPKLFLGFVFIIIFNVFFFVIVSKLEKINSITKTLKLQNEIKNHMLHLKRLHKVQETSVTSYKRLSRQESLDYFNQNQLQIEVLSDTINTKLDTIQQLNQAMLTRWKNEAADTLSVDPLKVTMSAIKTYNSVYTTMFDSIVQSKSTPVATKKTDIWLEILEEQSDKISELIDKAESIVDKYTNHQIKQVETKVDEVRDKTIFIIVGVMAIALIFGLGFSTYITTSLRRLTISAGNIGKGDFNVDPHKFPHDEIGDLASAFFQMSVDLKNAQEALIRSKRLAAIGEIVASVNHEINNPLMIISGNAQFLQMTMGEQTPETRERVQTILEETERISKVTRKLREIKNPVIEDYTSSGEQMINLDKSST